MTEIILGGESFITDPKVSVGHIINYDPSRVVKEEHIAYFTKIEGKDIILYEVYREYVEHPESNGQAMIPRIDVREVSRDFTSSFPEAMLLNNAQNNIRRNISRITGKD